MSSVTQSCVTLWPHGLLPTRLLCPRDFLDQNTRVGCHFLLQEMFLTQGPTHVSCTAGKFFTSEPLGLTFCCSLSNSATFSEFLDFFSTIYLRHILLCPSNTSHISIIVFLLELPFVTCSITQSFSVLILSRNLWSASFSLQKIPQFLVSLVFVVLNYFVTSGWVNWYLVTGKQDHSRSSSASEGVLFWRVYACERLSQTWPICASWKEIFCCSSILSWRT